MSINRVPFGDNALTSSRHQVCLLVLKLLHTSQFTFRLSWYKGLSSFCFYFSSVFQDWCHYTVMLSFSATDYAHVFTECPKDVRTVTV